MARGSSLRASDADRDRVADRLRNATAEGRLLAEELEERLERLFTSRTYGELAVLTSDLPAERGNRSPGPPLWAKAGIVLAAAVAVLAVTAMILLVLAGLAGAWMAWAFFAWVFFGGRRGRRTGRSRRRAVAGAPRAVARVPGGGPTSL